MSFKREATIYIGPDGKVYDLTIPIEQGRWVIGQAGWGTPPIDYIAQRGPFQDGATVKDFFLQPRVIQMLIRQNFCDRDGYWIGRGAIMNALRPNRQASTTANPGQLKRVLSDGSVRILDVFIAEGPKFEPSQAGIWQEHSFQEVLRFIAYNPVEYDDTEHCLTFDPSLSDLIFPITFPIVFGSFGGTQTAAYHGTWKEYPIITITGPVNGISILNSSTNEKIQLSYNIVAGEIVTIDLRPGQKTIVSSVNGNIIGTLTTDSNLATWHLGPDGEITDGDNLIVVTGSGLTVGTAVQICWHERFFGN